MLNVLENALSVEKGSPKNALLENDNQFASVLSDAVQVVDLGKDNEIGLGNSSLTLQSVSSEAKSGEKTEPVASSPENDLELSDVTETELLTVEIDRLSKDMQGKIGHYGERFSRVETEPSGEHQVQLTDGDVTPRVAGNDLIESVSSTADDDYQERITSIPLAFGVEDLGTEHQGSGGELVNIVPHVVFGDGVGVSRGTKGHALEILKQTSDNNLRALKETKTLSTSSIAPPLSTGNVTDGDIVHQQSRKVTSITPLGLQGPLNKVPQVLRDDVREISSFSGLSSAVQGATVDTVAPSQPKMGSSVSQAESNIESLGLVIKKTALNQVKSVSVKMTPVELGSVEVRISDVGGEMHVSLRAERLETNDLLAQQEQNMRDALKDTQQNLKFSFQGGGNRRNGEPKDSGASHALLASSSEDTALQSSTSNSLLDIII